MAEEAFNAAAEWVKTSTLDGVPSDRKLKLYSLYKQATEGDVTGSRPGILAPEARAKYDAWASVKGKSKEDLMTEYVAEIEAQKVEFA